MSGLLKEFVDSDANVSPEPVGSLVREEPEDEEEDEENEDDDGEDEGNYDGYSE
ncbi:MAG: hypothetical protein ABSA78_14080 [Candidatus Sulfotelmatobacter sp.]|jgi:hypothetical protein